MSVRRVGLCRQSGLAVPVVQHAWRSAAQTAAAVDGDALARDEARFLGGEEAHGMGDVPGVPMRSAGTVAR
jgi:hypothetical protein